MTERQILDTGRRDGTRIITGVRLTDVAIRLDGTLSVGGIVTADRFAPHATLTTDRTGRWVWRTL